MTEPELDALLQQYPGWVAIEQLVATIRYERSIIRRLQQTLWVWYDEGTVPQQTGESEQAYRARHGALRNRTFTQIMGTRVGE